MIAHAPAAALTRVAVRPAAKGLQAYAFTAPADILLVDGRTAHAEPGDYAVINGVHTLDVLSPARFRLEYDLVAPIGVVLSPADCARLEQTLGVGNTQIPTVLVQAVERLAAIHIGDVRLEFTPGQLSEIAYRATKRGHTIEQEIRLVVDRIRDEIFYRGGS